MRAVGCEDPHSARTGGVYVAIGVELEAVRHPRCLLGRSVDEHPTVLEHAFVVDVVRHPDLVLPIGIRDVGGLAVGGESDPVRTCLLFVQQLQFLGLVVDPVDSVEVEFPCGVFLLLGQTVGRIREVEPAVRVPGRVVRAVQLLAFEVVDDGLPFAVHEARNAPVAMLAGDERPVGVEHETVRSDEALARLAPVHALVEDRSLGVAFGPPHDVVGRDVAEQQVRAVALDPDGAFGEPHASGELFDLGAGGNDRVQCVGRLDDRAGSEVLGDLFRFRRHGRTG